MSRHYMEEESKPKNNRKALIIILCALVAVALISAGIWVWTEFYMKPGGSSLASAQEETQAAVTEAPTEAPTVAPTDPAYLSYLSTMTEHEKLCQLFIVTPEVLTGVDVATEAGDATKEALNNYPVGGLIYFSQNLEDSVQTTAMISNTQSYAKTPLFISVDEEGGLVARCAEKLGTTKFDPMYTYKDQGEQTAHDNAKTIASDIKQFGFNLDFAPIADVWTNPDNTVIGDRAYSDNFDQAVSLIPSAVNGFHDGGVMCTLKHFPGHGDTEQDSHSGLAYVTKTVDELKSGELLPFKAGIDAGADMVMIGHLVVQELDDKPATLSDKVVPELLRKELSYDGVTVTDGMNMGAIVDNYGYDEIIKGIFAADIDVILCPDNLGAYLEAMEKAISDGTITMEQVDAKVTRILKLKYDKGLMK